MDAVTSAAFEFLQSPSKLVYIISTFVQITIISAFSCRRKKQIAFENGGERALSNSALLRGMDSLQSNKCPSSVAATLLRSVWGCKRAPTTAGLNHARQWWFLSLDVAMKDAKVTPKMTHDNGGRTGLCN